jgi:hypothetical protein
MVERTVGIRGGKYNTWAPTCSWTSPRPAAWWVHRLPMTTMSRGRGVDGAVHRHHSLDAVTPQVSTIIGNGPIRADPRLEPTNNRAEVRSVDQKPSVPLGGLVRRRTGRNSCQPENSCRVSGSCRSPLVRG